MSDFGLDFVGGCVYPYLVRLKKGKKMSLSLELVQELLEAGYSAEQVSSFSLCSCGSEEVAFYSGGHCDSCWEWCSFSPFAEGHSEPWSECCSCC